jgi:hypothetical protein
MTEKTPTKRQRALFVLERLSDTLHADILRDPAFARQCNITVQRTMKSVDDFPLDWEMMFTAFRASP